jgi:hypothetical protein
MADTKDLLVDALQQDILTYQRNATFSAIQTASDSRNVSSSNFGVLQKNIVEYDASEAASAFAGTAHTQRMSIASSAGADSSQVAHSMLQLGQSQTNLQTQLAQISGMILGLQKA